MRVLRSLVCGLLLSVMGAEARAEVDLTLGAYSDYVFRGVSQTDEGPTPQLSLDVYGETGWYAGIWASDVDFDESGDWELNPYLGDL
ncbi:TorF family putative porin [Wenzhouxiangella marina]|uniref:Membrane protein n=1 Tax=Wenzhouxiangella marina TaxID=1579979 RepID=A0A0K0XUB6_9GAMM|nr:TorF family putative porin [Wenzhouxiangella marina]AKS41278.1 membrane protein [Wenzhouxiangella marina]MBB6086972.1 uncharacterized protein (TIGR02001 family) [Wenzhouxiangella marina]